MAKKLTEASLRKKLKCMDEADLIQMIIDLYNGSNTAEKAINISILGDDYGKELLEQYKKRLYKIFNPTNIMKTGFSLEAAQAVLDEFADICINSDSFYGGFALYFAECATDFTMSYGDIDENFYDALGDAYHDAVVVASNDEGIYEILKERLESVLAEFAGFGWGMEEYISDEYYSIPWIGEGEE